MEVIMRISIVMTPRGIESEDLFERQSELFFEVTMFSYILLSMCADWIASHVVLCSYYALANSFTDLPLQYSAHGILSVAERRTSWH